MIRDAGKAGTDFARMMETLCNGVFRWAVSKGFEKDCEKCEGVGGVPEDGTPIAEGAAGRLVRCDACKGIGSGYRNFGEQVALVHGELSELLEHHRTGEADKPDPKVPEFTNAEIEAADAVIRLMCMAGSYGWRLGRAIDAKMAYNDVRPFRHNKAY